MLKIPSQLEKFEIKDRLPLLLAAFVLFWTPIIVFSKIAGEVIEREPIGLDTSILLWIHAHAATLYDKVFYVITTIGNAEILGPICLLVVGLLWYKKRRLDALIVAATIAGAGAANVVLKALFHRTRPSFWHSMVHETSYSFPSGHAMLSSALLVSLMLIAWRTRARWWAIVGGSFAIVLIGLSRLYMGVHYPTDVVAGWCVSFLWACIVFAIAHGYVHRKRIVTSTAD